jgi:DNA-binding transcriptional LysR family regulator
MGLLRIATTGTVAEYVIPALVEAFARRMPSLEIQVGVDSPGSFRELLRLRRADMTIGPDPISELGIECVPFLRYELIVVSGRYNQAAINRDLSALARGSGCWGRMTRSRPQRLVFLFGGGHDGRGRARLPQPHRRGSRCRSEARGTPALWPATRHLGRHWPSGVS